MQHRVSYSCSISLIRSNCIQSPLALLELLETTEQNGGDSEHALGHNLPAAAAVSVGGITIESTGGLDVPMVSTPAGPVPGILILRQNKKRKWESIKAIRNGRYNFFLFFNSSEEKGCGGWGQSQCGAS